MQCSGRFHHHHYDKVKVTRSEKGFRIMTGGGNFLPHISSFYAMMLFILSVMNSAGALKSCDTVIREVRGYKKMEITSCVSVSL